MFHRVAFMILKAISLVRSKRSTYPCYSLYMEGNNNVQSV